MEAVARKLVRRDILPELAGFRDLGQQASHQVDELLLRLGDVLTSMQERHEFGAVVLAVVGDQRVRLEHRFEPFASVAWSVSEFGEMFEVAGDVGAAHAGASAGQGGRGPVAGPVVGYRALMRHRLIDPKRRRRRRSDHRRWERSQAMQLWQVDVMGRVRLGDGSEASVVTGIDDHSGLLRWRPSGYSRPKSPTLNPRPSRRHSRRRWLPGSPAG